MPFCDVSKYQEGGGGGTNYGIKIFYRNYGHGTTKVLLIIGLAGTHDSWGPQIKGLTGVDTPNDAESKTSSSKLNDPEEGFDSDDNEGIEVCSFDNRGMGQTSVPTKRSEYTTTIMARDAIALMDHLGWKNVHVFGHSMGAMIACKLAAMVPDRVLSLALLNATGGGFECFPKLDRQTISIAIRFLRAKTPEERAAVDLDTHYTKEYLDEYVGPKTRREILYQEYVKNISSTGMQSNYGFEGQFNACWTHKMTPKELEMIRSAGFPISVIHGRHDIIAQIYYARKIAEKLQPMARIIDLHGGHLVSHERPEEVNKALLELIKASELKLSPSDWSNLPKKDTWWQANEIQISSSRKNYEGRFWSLFMFDIMVKFHLCLLYIFGLFMILIEYGRKALRSLKPVRVGPSIS
ncbi:putative aminoacrylate hydrolase RutD [Telopea speciosissima]|uniref:putative aminoacrylate hydrolase RutD n=1 Tax=Telopea speciosissima TaxID=54955 RepID=UPI001CC515D4|nr:putative aminoacrylate hydrolase RutD [Telopea speciosissima]